MKSKKKLQKRITRLEQSLEIVADRLRKHKKPFIIVDGLYRIGINGVISTDDKGDIDFVNVSFAKNVSEYVYDLRDAYLRLLKKEM